MFKIIRRLIIALVLLFVAYHIYHIHQNVQQVMTYEPLVEEVLKENNAYSTTNKKLVLAMIYTETKGESEDVMQSSESSSGATNTITDSKSSIQQGVSVLSENLSLANKSGVDAWTAVQAYNFGTAYISYVAKHGSKNTVKLAEEYSRDVVAPSLGNKTGKSYIYYHPIALIYGGGKLYTNGGNSYYAMEVKFNLFLIRVFSSL
ncbi:lysozyme family protein [Streptococcus dentiloxodontae]